MFYRFVLLVLLQAALAVPGSSQWLVGSHMGLDGSLAGTPIVAGASLTSITNGIGFRMGFSIDAGAPESDVFGGMRTDRPAWSGEADLVYFPIGIPRAGGMAPFGTAGLGVMGGGPAEHNGMVGSTGGGIHLQLTEFFGIQAESRYRTPFSAYDDGLLPRGMRSGWEHRVSVAFTFGGGKRRRVVEEPPGRTPIAPPPRPVRTAAVLGVPAPPRAASARMVVAERTIDLADDYLGVPYQWGGSRPSSGFDCSGLVQYVYAKSGVTLPRVSRDQAHAGVPLPLDLDGLETGDLMFFASNGSRIDHVAIYAGDGRILHSSKSGGGVGYDHLWSRRGTWFRNHFVRARRVLSDGEVW